VDVDAILEGAADLLLIAGDGHGGTTAFFQWIAVIAAGAFVRVAVCNSLTYLRTGYREFHAFLSEKQRGLLSAWVRRGLFAAARLGSSTSGVLTLKRSELRSPIVTCQ
jgi:hypothetical protein